MSVRGIVIKAIGGLVIVSLLIGAIFLLSSPEKEDKKTEETVVLSLDKEKVTKVKIEGEESFSFTKQSDGVWVVDKMEYVGVKKANINALLTSLTNIKSEMCVSEKSEELSKFGLDKPQKVITITFDKGSETIFIGNRSGNYYYLKTASKDGVYIVKEADLSLAFWNRIKFLENKAVSVDANSLTKIRVGDMALYKDGNVWLEEKPYSIIADPEKVNALVSAISSIAATDIVKKDSVDITEGVEVFLADGIEEKTFLVIRGEDRAYIHYEGRDYLYEINPESTAFLGITGFDLIIKNMVMIPISEVSSIEFVSQMGKTVLSITAPSSEMPAYYKDGIEVSEQSFKDFYQKLAMVLFSGEGAAEGAAECAIIIKKESGEVIDIRFIEAQDMKYAVSINGVTHFTVNKKAVTDLFESLDKIEYVK